jgi:hypothetical protein
VVDVPVGTIELTKLTEGVVDPGRDWQFNIYPGPGGFGGSVLAGDSSFGDIDGVLDFAGVLLDARESFTVCELNVPAGWSSQWRIDTTGNGQVDTIVIAYNPNAADPSPQDLGNRCLDIGAGTIFPITRDETLVLEVDNRVPGGDPRTPGYWKNWNTCTQGGQADNAARNGGADEGFFLLDDILSNPGVSWGQFTISTCEEGVSVLDQRDQASGRKRASDAAYTLAAHLLAAELNFAAGANACAEAADAVLAARGLLVQIGFDGTGAYLRPRDAEYQQALSLAATLDEYNNGQLCGVG